MDWTAIITFVDPAQYIVVVACWVVGYMLKQTPKVPDWSIIFVVTLFAIFIISIVQGISAESVIQGILCGALAVYGNQIIKQLKKGGGNDANS